MTTIPIRGARLYVKVIGKGYPILFMHGGPGLDHSTFYPFERCADRFTLIFYDHRCNGRSNGVPVSSMTFENLTADAEALRQTLGFDRWSVLGHSFGGNVALEYALRYPASLSHLVVMDACGDSRWVQQNAPEILAKRGYRAAAVQAARRFYNGQLTPAEVYPTVCQFLGAYEYHPSPVFNYPRFLTLAGQMGLRPPIKMQPEAHVFGFKELLTGWTVMDRLSEIKAPTLIMAGRDDFLAPPQHLAVLAEQIPNAQLELIECAGHNPHMERPEQVIPIIERFIGNQP